MAVSMRSEMCWSGISTYFATLSHSAMVVMS